MSDTYADIISRRMFGGSMYNADSQDDLPEWANYSFDPDDEGSDSSTIANRVLSAYRNNVWVKRVVDSKVALEVGDGIRMQPNTGNKTLDDAISELISDSYYNSSLSDDMSLSGIQAQSVRSKLFSGNSFLNINYSGDTTETPTAIRFQSIDNVLHAEYGENQGIVLNQNGKPTGYQFYKSVNNQEVVTVGKDYIIHHFNRIRAGQLKGVSEIAQILPKAYSFEKYNQSELHRKKIRSTFSGVIEKPVSSECEWAYDPVTGQKLDYDRSALPSVEIQSGTFANLLSGESLKLFDGDTSGDGYADFQHWQLLAMASGVNLPFQLLSGDFASINDRLWRAIFNDLKRSLEANHYNSLVPQLIRPMYLAIVSEGIESGYIKQPKSVSDFAVRRAVFKMQPFPYINLAQDINAKQIAVEEGFIARSTVIDELNNGDITREQLDTMRKADKATDIDTSADRWSTQTPQPQPQPQNSGDNQ